MKTQKKKDIIIRLPWKEGRKWAWVHAAQLEEKSLAEWAGGILDVECALNRMKAKKESPVGKPFFRTL